jgi:predicted MFS family arabinose efflux permease
MVAGTCGPSIGGILADRIGFRATFLVSTVLTLLAALVVLRRLPRQPALRTDVRVSARDLLTLLRNPRMMALMLAASVPAKIILTSFAFYLIPLYITSIGSNPSTTGRLLMLYAIMMVFFTPLAAQISDRVGRRPIFVGIGLALTGIGGLLVLINSGVWIMLAVVLLLGIGQSISIAPQSALVGELVRSENIPLSEGTSYGVYRLVERLGNTAGPFIAAVLLARFGFATTFVSIGAGVVFCALIFMLTTGSKGREESIPLGGLSAENVGIAG